MKASLYLCLLAYGFVVLQVQAQWVAFNDQGAGSIGPAGQAGTQTGIGVTTYGIGPGRSSSGPLTNSYGGQELPVILTITTNPPGGVSTSLSGAAPNAGTPLASTFDGYVWFGPSAAGQAPACIQVSPGHAINYTFSNLDPSMVYRLSAGAVRGADSPTTWNRWTLVDIQGVDCVVPRHQQGPGSPWGYLDASRVPPGPGAPTNHQVALQFGNNVWGDMVEYDLIMPGDDGTFTITCAPYTGAVPAGWGTTNVDGSSSPTSSAYAITGIRLESVYVERIIWASVSPQSLQVEACSSVTFQAYPSAAPLYQYHWYKDSSTNPIANATNSILVLENVQPGVDDGSYWVVVTTCDTCGCIEGFGSGRLTVIPASGQAVLQRAISSTNLHTITATFSKPVTISSPTGADFLARPSTGEDITFIRAVVTDGTNVILTTARPLQQKNYTLLIQGNGVQHACAGDVVTNSTRIIQSIVLMGLADDTSWRYWDNGTDPGTTWLTQDVSSWPSGQAAFDVKRDSNRLFITTYIAAGQSFPLPVRTHLNLTNSNYQNGTRDIPTAYFRTAFNFPGDPSQSLLTLNAWLTGGAVFHLNHQESCRQVVTNAPDGTLPFDMYCPAQWWGFIGYSSKLPTTNLMVGTNELAVMLKQGNANSDAWTMAMSLVATVTNFVEVPDSRLMIACNPDETLTLSWSPPGGTLQESATLQANDWHTSSAQANPQTRTNLTETLFFRVLRP